MSLKYRTSAGTSASNFTDLVVKVGDTLPIGTEVDYDGQTAPAGWQEVDDPNVYSTTETKVGTWIDGKPLYRKVIETNVSGTTQMVIPHGISNLAWMIRCDITMLNQYNYFMADGKDINDVSVDSGNIYFTSAWPTGNAKIILEYTKTTD